MMKSLFSAQKSPLVFLILLLSIFSSRGNLVQPAVTLTLGGFGGDYLLSDGSHLLSLDLSASGLLTPVNYSLGGEFAWYQSLASDDVFDINYVETHAGFAGNFDMVRGTVQTVLDAPFFLGYYVQNNVLSQFPQPTAADGYGWAKLVRTNAGLTLLDSALQNEEQGIIVGTTTATPEPSTWLLLMLGVGAIFLRVRKLRKT